MTLDELVVRVRVAVEEADGELDAVLSDLRRFAGEAAAAAGDAAAPQEALWAELAEAAKGAFSQVAEAVRAGLSLAAAVPAGEEGQALREAWGALLGPEGALAGDLTSLGEAAQTALPAVGEGLTALLETFQAAAEGAESLSERCWARRRRFRRLRRRRPGPRRARRSTRTRPPRWRSRCGGWNRRREA